MTGPNDPKALVRREVSILSPLRYPGAKRRLSGYIAEVLRLNGLRPKLFVEPFAGGASVALELLNRDLVDQIALAEKDALLASFWKIVFRDPDWLIRKLSRLSVTVRAWDYYRRTRFRSHHARALACLFLNRTSFSGILSSTAGPIGGRAQRSKYKVDCRFPVPTLVKRLRQAAALRDRVAFVDHADWLSTIKKVSSLGYAANEVFYYLDPPFYEKADRLYNFYFSTDDHERLHDVLMGLSAPWLLSYDPADAVFSMYSEAVQRRNGTGPKQVDLIYSAGSTKPPTAARELIITNLSGLPEATRVWRSAAEWKRSAA